MQILELIDDHGQFAEAHWFARAQPVHVQLRPNLPADYTGRLAVIAHNGGRLIAVTQNDQVLGLALWRLIENTYEGRRLYVDDLVTDATVRSTGVGKKMLDWLETKARAQGCDVLALDSGVQRTLAHKFYFREGLHIPSFNFKKALK
ncbi:GNAT family N-acetyltransferase [Silvimonas iriomotensis]|uniref:N-acetyltransferase GCN5 n=1 Tax=Silvimonas iriomotensis TaxID=449662 RepID=A0ABQ2P8Z3_9NEIS|nr:GNAT family N-acetyltransferase [Silvimonas iriomotensis]GGP21238.1 N-acetyltransferase GCN5 [Silvimonas iriomotensis]